MKTAAVASASETPAAVRPRIMPASTTPMPPGDGATPPMIAASFEIMGRDRGFSRADRRAVVMAGVREYRSRMRRAAGMGSLNAWYEHFEAGMLLKLVRDEMRVKRVSKKEARAFHQDIKQAQTRDSTRVFAKRASEYAGELRIVPDPPLIVPIEDLVERCAAQIGRAHV